MGNILHFCKMLSRVGLSGTHTGVTERWRSIVDAPAHRLAVVQEIDTETERREYLARLGEVLKQARRAAGVTQVVAAERLKMDPSAFTRWEAGANRIGAYELSIVCRLIGPELDLDLIIDPPASKVEIQTRLAPVKAAAAARMAAAGKVKRPRPTLVPTEAEQNLVAQMQASAIDAAADQDLGWWTADQRTGRPMAAQRLATVVHPHPGKSLWTAGCHRDRRGDTVHARPTVDNLGMRIRRLVWMAVALFALNGCAGSPIQVVADDVEGWTRSPNFTTCIQWADEMTDGQRAAMARTLLPILRAQVDTAATDGNELVPTFVADISAKCKSPEIAADPEYVITPAATLAFFDDKSLQP